MKELLIKIKRYFDFKKRNIRVWPGTYIYPTAQIGSNVSIGRNCEIGDGVTIGKNTRIGTGAFLPAGVHIGENCFIGPHAVFSNDMYPPSSKDEWKHTYVSDYAAIGAGVRVRPGIKIGHGALVGMGSVVTKDIPVNEVWVGNPAKYLKGWGQVQRIRTEITRDKEETKDGTEIIWKSDCMADQELRTY